MSHSYARYSAHVSAMRGVAMRSTAGSSARFRNSTARSIADVERNSRSKKSASSNVMPIAANTTANSPSSRFPAFVGSSLRCSTADCRAIWAASSLCGSPEPEKIGSFCPRTSGLSPSMAETPVWMKSSGKSRAVGLIGSP